MNYSCTTYSSSTVVLHNGEQLEPAAPAAGGAAAEGRDHGTAGGNESTYRYVHFHS